MARIASRWLPALIVPLIVVGAITVPFVAANASPNLPAKSAAEIMASLAKAEHLPGYSGTLHQDSNLGLPQLPTVSGASTGSSQAANAGTELLNLIGTDQDIRVAVNREAGLRVQLLEPTSEQDLIVNRGNIWQWDDASQSATHVRLPQLTADERARLQELQTRSQVYLPQYSPLQLSEALIKQLDSHSRVSVGASRYVAGKAAYTLIFTPRESATTVRDIQVQVDAKTGLPLRFGIYAKAQREPAYELGYTSLDYTVPAAATFNFKAPTNAKVKTIDYTLPPLRRDAARLHAQVQDKPAGEGIQVLTQQLLPQLKELPAVGVSGTGWASVIRIPATTQTRALLKDRAFASISTPVGGEDSAIQTTLLNVRIHPDGSISLGAVPLANLK